MAVGARARQRDKVSTNQLNLHCKPLQTGRSDAVSTGGAIHDLGYNSGYDDVQQLASSSAATRCGRYRRTPVRSWT
jgi:hypothetical protein